MNGVRRWSDIQSVNCHWAAYWHALIVQCSATTTRRWTEFNRRCIACCWLCEARIISARFGFVTSRGSCFFAVLRQGALGRFVVHGDLTRNSNLGWSADERLVIYDFETTFATRRWPLFDVARLACGSRARGVDESLLNAHLN